METLRYFLDESNYGRIQMIKEGSREECREGRRGREVIWGNAGGWKRRGRGSARRGVEKERTVSRETERQREGEEEINNNFNNVDFSYLRERGRKEERGEKRKKKKRE